MLNHGWRRWHGEKEYSLTTKDTKSTKVITEMKQEENTSQRIAAGGSRNNSLTQCIIFISFMNFMVKKAVLCDLRVLPAVAG